MYVCVNVWNRFWVCGRYCKREYVGTIHLMYAGSSTNWFHILIDYFVRYNYNYTSTGRLQFSIPCQCAPLSV